MKIIGEMVEGEFSLKKKISCKFASNCRRFFLFAAVWFILFPAVGCKKTNVPAPNIPIQTRPALSAEALKQQRLEWNLKTLVEAYKNAFHTNAKWDAFATVALTEFARARAKVLDANEPWAAMIATNVTAAVQTGCDDPMVNYLFIKFALSATNTATTFADDFCHVALEMDKSSYPAIRKYYAAAAAMDQLFLAYRTNTVKQPIAHEILPLLGQSFTPAMADKTMPAAEAYELADRALHLVKGGKKQFVQGYYDIEQPLFENWPNDSLTWLFKGSSYIQMAWLERGGGYANNVADEKWKSFFDDLAIADEALTNAWNLNSNDERAPIQMIRVAEGRQKPRDEMEVWFHRAMVINTNCYEACENKLHYLYPQWYGSRADMISFGRECAASTNWGGKVPLILADAHREYWLYLEDAEDKANYWKHPDVWPDVKMAFERFFELNRNQKSYYHNYAWCAYQCGQWDKFNELMPKLEPVNYGYFGGKEEFEKMVQTTREKIKASHLDGQK